MLNLGPKTAAWLTAAGIHTRAQLAQLGPIGVCRRIRAAGHPASVALAYAIEGFLQNTPWHALPAETKVRLRAEFAAMQPPAGPGSLPPKPPGAAASHPP